MSRSEAGGDVVMKLKSCPKCKGNVIIDRDQYGWYEQCMQCGYLADLEDIVLVEKPPVKIKKYKKAL